MTADTAASPPSLSDPPVIELEGLSVHFGKREILQNLRIALRGRAIGLLGPNGAGKSTLIQTLLGFCPIAAGSAAVLGLDIRRQINSLRALIGYMPENDGFIAEMTGVDFVALMGELSGLPPDAALERAHEALFYVGLGEARYRAVGTYSQGMKQLAKLAQAIVHGPRLIILDEPTNGLDPPARSRMLRLIREMRDEQDVRLVVSSHLLPDVEEICDEVVILRRGRVVHHCDLAEERRADRRYVDLEAAGSATALIDSLRLAGCNCEGTEAGRFRLVTPPGFALSRIAWLAARHGVELRHLRDRRDTLEAIFLKAMEN